MQTGERDTFLFGAAEDDGAKDDISPYVNTAKQTAAQRSAYDYGPYTMNQAGVGGFYNRGLFAPKKKRRIVHSSPWEYVDGQNPDMKATGNWAAN
jgi:hypothetical protein